METSATDFDFDRGGGIGGGFDAGCRREGEEEGVMRPIKRTRRKREEEATATATASAIVRSGGRVALVALIAVRSQPLSSSYTAYALLHYITIALWAHSPVKLLFARSLARVVSCFGGFLSPLPSAGQTARRIK